MHDNFTRLFDINIENRVGLVTQLICNIGDRKCYVSYYTIIFQKLF